MAPPEDQARLEVFQFDLVQAGIKDINDLGADKIEDLFHATLDDLCEDPSCSSTDRLTAKFATAFGDMGKTDRAVKACKVFCRQACSSQLSKDEVKADLNQLGVTDNVASGVASAINGRVAQVRQSMTRGAKFQKKLKDFDWKLQLVLASEKMSSMKGAVLLLELSLESPSGKLERHVVELSTSMLDSLLGGFKEISEVVAELQP